MVYVPAQQQIRVFCLQFIIRNQVSGHLYSINSTETHLIRILAIGFPQYFQHLEQDVWPTGVMTHPSTPTPQQRNKG